MVFIKCNTKCKAFIANINKLKKNTATEVPYENKKVLLHESKRHRPPRSKCLLCCSVSGSIPHLGLDYSPSQDLGTPRERTRVPPAWDWGTPWPGLGYPPTRTGIPLTGVPLSVNEQTPMKTLPSPFFGCGWY